MNVPLTGRLASLAFRFLDGSKEFTDVEGQEALGGSRTLAAVSALL